MIEIVLPSGRFARFRPVTVDDLMRAHGDDPMRTIVALAVLTGVIDGVNATPEMALSMTLDEFGPVVRVITDELKKLSQHTRGIA